MSTESERVGLRSYLRERLTPLVVLLFAVVAISAPVAYYIMGARTVEATAQATSDMNCYRLEAS